MKKREGFTLVELLIGSSIMLVIIFGALSMFVKSNKISVDHQQLAEVQHDVRSAMYFVSRDVRSAGVGLLPEIAGYFLEGTDGHGPNPESPDSIKLMGNYDDQLNLRIEDYQGASATAFLYPWEIEHNPYDCPDYYENKIYIIIATKSECSGCFALRFIPENQMHGCGGGAVHFNFPPGQSELNPPGGLTDTNCGSDCWDEAIVTICQIKQYWLDTTGNPADYSDLNLTVGQDGYLGIANTLYLTTTDEIGGIMHLPLAQNIESLQFQYNGDLDDDGNLDGFIDWDNNNWTINPGDDAATKEAKLEIIARIRQVKIWVLGRTERPFVSVSGTPSTSIHHYRRPAVANSSPAAQDDKHRRFLLESTANIRNMSLRIYNDGTR